MNIHEYFPSKWLKAEDLKGKEVILTITEVTEFTGDDGRTQPVLSFKGTEKQLGLNKTNAMIVASKAGPETDDWIGHSIKLYPTKTEFAGKRVACIRIDDEFHRAPGAAAAAAAAPKAPVAVAEIPDDEEIPF